MSQQTLFKNLIFLLVKKLYEVQRKMFGVIAKSAPWNIGFKMAIEVNIYKL